MDGSTAVQVWASLRRPLWSGRHGAGPRQLCGLRLGHLVGLDVLYAPRALLAAGRHVHGHGSIEREEGLHQHRRRGFTTETGLRGILSPTTWA